MMSDDLNFSTLNEMDNWLPETFADNSSAAFSVNTCTITKEKKIDSVLRQMLELPVFTYDEIYRNFSYRELILLLRHWGISVSQKFRKTDFCQKVFNIVYEMTHNPGRTSHGSSKTSSIIKSDVDRLGVALPHFNMMPLSDNEQPVNVDSNKRRKRRERTPNSHPVESIPMSNIPSFHTQFENPNLWKPVTGKT